MQLLTTSCFLKSESSHSLANHFLKVCFVRVGPSGWVRCGLTLGVFAGVQSQFFTAPQCHTLFSLFHPSSLNLPSVAVMQPIRRDRLMHGSSLAIGGMVRQDKLML